MTTLSNIRREDLKGLAADVAGLAAICVLLVGALALPVLT